MKGKKKGKTLVTQVLLWVIFLSLKYELCLKPCQNFLSELVDLMKYNTWSTYELCPKYVLAAAKYCSHMAFTNTWKNDFVNIETHHSFLWENMWNWVEFSDRLSFQMPWRCFPHSEYFFQSHSDIQSPINDKEESHPHPHPITIHIYQSLYC